MKDNGVFKYFLSDHLGSISLVLDDQGGILEGQRYLPFGEPRTMAPYADVTSTDFTYTGQRALPDTGLMDYKARFYSPSLKRFIQPDTIVPGAIYSQTWNRYSYVLNNPINVSDPTGHKCVGEPEECLSLTTYQGWQNGGDLSSSNRPDRPDHVTLPTDATKEAIWLYSAYREMWKDKDGWWWTKYGSGGFTIWEFMGVMWAYEQQGFQDTDKYAAAMGNHAPGWCDYMGCDPSTAVGSLTFMGRYNQVGVARARNLFMHPGIYSVQDIFDAPKGYWPGDSMQIVEAIQKDYFSGDPYAPYNVGNMSLRSKIFKKMASLGMIDTIWGLPGQDRMIILTYCQTLMMDYALNTDGAKSINMRTYRSFCPGG